MLAQHVSPAPRPAERPPPAVRPSGRSDRAQRALDLAVGLVVAVLAVPLVAVAWAVVRLTSAGPGFYSQVRVGRNGRHYRIYKLRTMRHDCEAASGAQWSTKGDLRVTPVGRVLRKLHIDELPQLFNVLRGNMSLVGPRPERPEFVVQLCRAVPGYADRLAVRPGVTGLAQIQLPPDESIESVRKKVVLDRCYVGAGGLWLDVRILLGTAVYLVGFSYARVRRLTRLPNPHAEEAAKSGGGGHGTTAVGPHRVGCPRDGATTRSTDTILSDETDEFPILPGEK